MVLYVTAGVNQTLAFKLFKHLGRVFTQNINQHIETATVSHGHNNLFTAVFPRAAHQTVQQWDQALTTLKTKALGPRIFGVQMLLQPLCRSQATENINPGFVAIGRLGAHRLKALGQPLLFSKAGDMHKFRAQMATVSLFQSLDDLTQSCLRLAHVQGARLERSVQIRLGQAMEMQVQIGHIFPLHNAQRIQVGLLVATETVGTDELNNLYLLALMLEVNTTGTRRRGWSGLTAAKKFEMLNNGSVGNIGSYRAIGAGERVEKAAPLLWHAVGLVQISFVEFFNVRRVSTGKVGGAQKLLH